jgi:CO/xanthine dehydrogenase Mo-binding subunit
MTTSLAVRALRVVQDLRYATSLSNEQWTELVKHPEWMTLAAEQPELVQAVLDHIGIMPAFAVPDTPSLSGDNYQVLGKSIPRMHGAGIVTGRGRYTHQLTMPGMLFMKTLRSPYPHARIKKIDSSKAEKMPGVVAVVHRFNAPKEYLDYRVDGPPNRYIFPEEVFEVGSAIGAIAAETEHLAEEAMRQIAVEYEELPAVVNPLEALKSSTPRQWDSKLDGTILTISRPMLRGEPDKALASADAVVESVTERNTEQNVPLEPTSGLYWWDNDRLNMVWTTRWPHGHRGTMARALKLDESKVRLVNVGYLGSSYGSHRDIEISEMQAAILAKIANRPVRQMNSRAEDIMDRTHRGATRNECKMGVKRDGTIVGATFKIIGDCGAVRRFSTAAGSWSGLQNTYTIPNLRLEGIDVLTNRFKTGTFRCVGHPNGTFALEVLIEKAAYAIGMNPLEFRLKNLNEVGNPESKRPFSNPGIRDCLLAAADGIGFKAKWHAPKAKEARPGVFHGVALAAHMCNHGAGGNPSTGMLVINSDGSLTVISGAAEIGGGQRTQMAIIASEVLGIPFAMTSISVAVDSDATSDTGLTAGSRQTNSAGWGMYEAAQDARRQVLDWAAKRFASPPRGPGFGGGPQIISEEGPERGAAAPTAGGVKVSPADLDIKDGIVFIKNEPSKKLTMREVVSFAGNPILGRGAHVQDPKWERLAMAAHAVEIEVDTVTGQIKVTKYVAAHDVGRAINRQAVEQQIEGGVVMGLGAALLEQLLVDEATGLPINPNILDYKLASIKDVPEKIDMIIIQKPKEYGVFGAHGIGEPPIAMAVPAIANAVYNAVGVWLEKPPFTPAKVLTALKAGQ